MFGGLGGLFFAEGRIETAIFDKEKNRLSIERKWIVPCYFGKYTYHPLNHIIRIRAARRGFCKDGVDQTVYVLIITLIKGSEIKILETRNPTKIRKEVSQ